MTFDPVNMIQYLTYKAKHMDIYQHLISFLGTEMAHVVEKPPWRWQDHIYPVWLVPFPGHHSRGVGCGISPRYPHLRTRKVVIMLDHDGVIEWKHFPRYWPFVRGIHQSPVYSPQKSQWRRALMFSLIWVWMNGWVNNREAGDLRRHRAHYNVTVMHIYVYTYSCHYQYPCPCP